MASKTKKKSSVRKTSTNNKLFVLILCAIVALVGFYAFNRLVRYPNAKAGSNNWTNIHFNNTTFKICTYTSSSNTPRIRAKVYNPTPQVRWAQLIVNTVNVGGRRQHQYDRITPADFNKIKDYPDRSGGVPRTFYVIVNIGVDERTKGINFNDINKCDKPFVDNDEVVRVATREYNLYGNRNLESNGFYYKYTQGRNDPWCGHFIKWVFNEANKEFPPGVNVAAVSGIRSYFESINKYRPKSSGYRPRPGDIAIYQNNMSHANIVVSVSNNSYTAIGGNETDGIGRRTYSFSDPNLSGFGQR